MASAIQNWWTVGDSTANPAPRPETTTDLSKDTFLKLLVAQVRNQDPLNPADGVEFLTQLAQFTELEQTLNIAQDLTAIRAALEAAAAEKPAE